MGKLLVSFDSYEAIDGYEGRQAIAQMRRMEGVSEVKVYRAMEGQPRYLITVDVSDEAADTVQKAIQSAVAPYSGYLNNFSVRKLKEMSL